MRQFASEVDGRECHFLGGFSKISLAIPDRFAWWRENQILQVEAHLVVPFPRPGKFVEALNLLFEDSLVTPKFARCFNNMACSDTSNTLYNTSLEQLCANCDPKY